jgi:hypothetical protein
MNSVRVRFSYPSKYLNFLNYFVQISSSSQVQLNLDSFEFFDCSKNIRGRYIPNPPDFESFIDF